MNAYSVAFLLINTVALLLVPRRWAPLPFLIGACYMTRAQGIDLGPLSFTVLRILILFGFARLVLRGERLAGGMNGLDWLMLVWALWTAGSSVFHKDPVAALIFRLSMVYDACGIYFLLRAFCKTVDDVVVVCRLTAIVLLPVAVEMISEKITVYNQFSVLGGVNAIPYIRNDHVRASGPFAHAILAGTVGAACLPMMVGLWNVYRNMSVAGISACIAMIYSSGSSGPFMVSIAAVGALMMWRYQRWTRRVLWFGVLCYLALDLYMKDPAYFIMARIDLAGGSTGWHRARLIQSSLEHFSEWWLAGTDYTRHWMASGVSWSPNHADITNHYLQMGVIGGLLLMLLFIAVLVKGFSYVGQTLNQSFDLSAQSRFMIWALGASLFVHTLSFISVSYFDQSVLFIYLTLALISSVKSGARLCESS